MSYQSVSEALGKWVNKPLAKLPRDLQPIATAYIPQWQTLTPKQRTDRAIEVDRQRGLKSKLRYDRATRSQQAARDPAREAVGWYDATLEADHWAALGDISPIDAAMLLCRFNPNENSYDDARQTTTDELGPGHLVRLAQRLADIGEADHKPRTLRDWHQTARGLGLTYHSWVDGYIEATTPPAPPEQATTQQPRTVPAVSAIEWEAVPLPESYRPPAPPVADTAPPEPQAETKEQRQDRRLQACIDDGLEMLTKAALLRLPDGVGRLADIEGVKRQSFSIDVKAAQKRRANAVRDGGK